MCPPQLSVAFDSGDRAGVRICDSGPTEFPRFDGAVHPSRDDVDPDIYPDDSPLSPAEWLAEHVTDRLGDLDYVDGHTFGGARAAIEPGRLTGPDAGPPGAVAGTSTLLGDVFAAHRLRTAPAGTRTVTATAHDAGFGRGSSIRPIAATCGLHGNAGNRELREDVAPRGRRRQVICDGLSHVTGVPGP